MLGGRHNHLDQGSCAVSRIRTGVVAATKRSTNHYTNTAVRVGILEVTSKSNITSVKDSVTVLLFIVMVTINFEKNTSGENRTLDLPRVRRSS